MSRRIARKKNGNWLSISLKILEIILLFGSSLFGYMYASDAVMDSDCDVLFWIFLLLIVVISIILAIFCKKVINKYFLVDVVIFFVDSYRSIGGVIPRGGFATSFISCFFLITGWLSFIVFGLNKYTGKDTTQEVRVKVKECSKHNGWRHSYLIDFTLPTSKGYKTYDIGDDSSYMHRDSCTVVYHRGCLGMYYIDDVKP